MGRSYRVAAGQTSGTGKALGVECEGTVGGKLEEIACEGARRMLAQALEMEVEEFLQRGRYGRADIFRGYRNGHSQERTIGVGLGAVSVRVPRVREVPKEVAENGFQSQIVPRYQRLSTATEALFARLYLEGLSTGDFEPVFRAILGEAAPLSATSITRLKEEWQGEYDVWRRRRLEGHRYVYIWADGVYLAVGSEDEKSALLCVVGLREDGEKELLAMQLGYRESTESWGDVLRDLKERGMNKPILAIGDGALGIWAAMREVWPETRPQRCWNHRILNVLDKLPKRLWAKVRKDLRKAWQSCARDECKEQMLKIAADLQKAGQVPAAETVVRDLDDFLAYYDFPEERWTHLRTTNPIESVFAGVRIRTNVARSLPNRENALYLVFKVVQRLSRNWRKANGSNLCQMVLDSERFMDGKRIMAKVA